MKTQAKFSDLDLYEDYDDTDYQYQQYLQTMREQTEKFEPLVINNNKLEKWNIEEAVIYDDSRSAKNEIEKAEIRAIYQKREEYYFIHRTELLEKTHQL